MLYLSAAYTTVQVEYKTRQQTGWKKKDRRNNFVFGTHDLDIVRFYILDASYLLFSLVPTSGHGEIGPIRAKMTHFYGRFCSVSQPLDIIFLKSKVMNLWIRCLGKIAELYGSCKDRESMVTAWAMDAMVKSCHKKWALGPCGPPNCNSLWWAANGLESYGKSTDDLEGRTTLLICSHHLHMLAITPPHQLAKTSFFSFLKIEFCTRQRHVHVADPFMRCLQKRLI